MSRVNRTTRQQIETVMQAVAEFQDAADRLDEGAAAKLGVNRTDLRCLGVLVRSGRATAGELAMAAGRSRASGAEAAKRSTLNPRPLNPKRLVGEPSCDTE